MVLCITSKLTLAEGTRLRVDHRAVRFLATSVLLRVDDYHTNLR